MLSIFHAEDSLLPSLNCITCQYAIQLDAFENVLLENFYDYDSIG
jgi:hypothetical protein